MPSPLAPGLYFVATPIGAARDITLRALDILAQADVLAAEDTRNTRKLLDIHGVKLNGRRLIAYHDHNGDKSRPALIRALKEGQVVAYVSDAGTPLVADPGFDLGRAAIAEGVAVFSAPGASAVLAALCVSGLPTDRFYFAGFLPSKAAARKTFIAGMRNIPGTLIMFDAPRRVQDSFAALADGLGADRPAVYCRELTKRFETTVRANLGDMNAALGDEPAKGECVILVGAAPVRAVSDADIHAAMREAMKTHRLKDAANLVAEQLTISKRVSYQIGLQLAEADQDGT